MKAIFLSILGGVLFVGMLLGVVYLFTTNWMLGIVGIILLAIFPRILFAKAAGAARGPITKLLAKLVVPILSAVIGVLIILTAFVWA